MLRKEKYEKPEVITFSEDQIMDTIGPEQTFESRPQPSLTN